MLLRRVLRAVFGLVPTLDLHGLGVADAIDETARFVAEAATRGEREVRIVYGKGRGSPGGVGVLRQAIPAWLEQHGRAWVERFAREIDADGIVRWIDQSSDYMRRSDPEVVRAALALLDTTAERRAS